MDKSDMFEYIGDGNTLYDKIRKYFPKLNGDFSTASLLNHLKEQQIPDMRLLENTYNENFELISNSLINAVKKSEEGNYAEITPDKVQDLISELKGSDGDSYRGDIFSSIEEYVEYAKYKMNAPDIKKVREIIINHGMNVLPEKKRDSIRTALLESAYLPKVNTILKASSQVKPQNTESTRNFLNNDSGLGEVEKAYNVLKNSRLRKLYDSYLKDYMEKRKEIEKRLMVFEKCTAKREVVVTDAIKSTMGANEQNSATVNKNLLYPILGAPGSVNQRRGKYDWEFIEYEQPQLLLNADAIYSQNGIENQRVIVANHGRINFKSGGKDNISEELIGVTRIGEDKERTYFVAVPRGSIQQTIKGQEDFFAKVFLSDYYLEQVENDYNRFAGTVVQKQGKPKIVKETIGLIGSDERDALNYAQNYNGKYKSRKTTLEDICHPHSRIPQKHKTVVEFVKDANFAKDIKDQIDTVEPIIPISSKNVPEDPEGSDR